MCLEKTMQEFFDFFSSRRFRQAQRPLVPEPVERPVLIKEVFHIGSFLGTLRGLEIRFLMEAEQFGDEVGGEHTDEGVVVLHRFVELPACIGDAVFAAFEL